ncbi:hypothetical protein [Burkholderia territorii]|uniref:hypothetical protein n=1 Tax=Burkholderia territorii TaxID=1503055 RepID=UPI0007531871|nr:hypothetical protein [Burkholderia territorii]KVQ57513.1 hypothetical protein WT23_28365 [Burkholderia territorii]
MKEFVLVVAAVAIWCAVWRALARHWRAKGWGPLISHTAAALAGFVVSIIPFIILGPGKGEPGATPASENVSKQESMKPVRADGDDAKKSPSAESGNVPTLPAVFTGAASDGALNAENWPKVATVALDQSDFEKRYLADQTCLDETECYGPKRFERDIVKRYPDIAKIKYHPVQDEADDADTVAMRREQFVHGLYFAKQIKLANGQTLFDFMRTCARGFTSLDGAESAYDSKSDTPYFDVRYYPTLRRVDTGQPIELQILFERRGDKLVAQSPFFTTNAVRYADFLQRHKVECWNPAR